MATSTPTPAEIAAHNIAYDKANNHFYHKWRFEVQLHTGHDRRNIKLPTWDLVEIVLRNTVKADDPRRPDRVIVCDGRDTCVQVLKWEKSCFGYKTTLRRGAAIGEEPRF